MNPFPMMNIVNERTREMINDFASCDVENKLIDVR